MLRSFGSAHKIASKHEKFGLIGQPYAITDPLIARPCAVAGLLILPMSIGEDLLLTFMTSYSKELSQLAQALALVAAAIFFVWKLISGYLYCNLSLQMQVTRAPKSAGIDYLTTELKLLKGERSSIELKSVKVIVNGVGFDLVSPLISDGTRMVRLTPGESTHFSHMCEVDSRTACHVEASVDGKPSLLTMGHWKASVHSVPRF
jgi:hypothetical protein